MWDQRYAVGQYVYGTDPNAFFREELKKLTPGKLLLPAEGEGRNAIYAASRGWEVTAFDTSSEGRNKALRLAEQRGVSIQYQLAGYRNVLLPEDYFNSVAMIYAHAPAAGRTQRHRRMLDFLKDGGTFMLEGFAKEQIRYPTGGPRDVDMLFSEEELRYDFRDLKELTIRKEKIELREGLFHNGLACVIRLTGKK